MNKYAIVKDGMVVNSAISESPLGDDWIATDNPQIGWTYDGDKFSPPAPSPPTQADFDQALTSHLDTTAQSRRYDDRITCMVRAGFAGPFQAEGQAFALWADSCNAYAYQLLADVQAGTRNPPESLASFIAELPVMVWP